LSGAWPGCPIGSSSPSHVFDLRRTRLDRCHRLASRPARLPDNRGEERDRRCRWPRPTGRPLPAARMRHRPGSALVAGVRRCVGRRRGWPHCPAPFRRTRNHAQTGLPGRWARNGGLDPSAGARCQRPLLLAICSPDESWAAPAGGRLSCHARRGGESGRLTCQSCCAGKSGKHRRVQLSPDEGLAERPGVTWAPTA
jgi:hypothetical protein